jgi:hypothetical protein
MRVFLLLVAALALMAVTPPSVAQDQQKLVRVAMVRGGNPGPDPVREAFVEGMRALGYVEGRNIVYEFRYAAGNDAALLRQHMHEVVHWPVDIIVTGGTPAGLAACHPQIFNLGSSLVITPSFESIIVVGSTLSCNFKLDPNVSWDCLLSNLPLPQPH